MFMYGKKFYIFIVFLYIMFDASALQFGNGSKKSETTFVHVRDNVLSVSIDNYTSFIIDGDYTLWGTGFQPYSRYGKQGTAITDDFVIIYKNVLHFEDNILKLINGDTYFINNGLYNISSDFIKISHKYWLKNDGTLWFSNNNEVQDLKLLRTKIKNFYANDYYTLILTESNELLIGGEYHIPGIKNDLDEFVKLADNVKTFDEGFYITLNDELYAFGYNGAGALGISNEQTYSAPVLVMDDVKKVESNQQSTLILKNDGTLYGCGGKTPNYFGELGFGNKLPVLKPELIMSDVKEIAVGLCTTAIIKNDNSLWMCGANDFVGLM